MRSTKTKMIIIIASIIAVAVIILLVCVFALPKKVESKQEELWKYVFCGNVKNMFQSYFDGEDYDEILKNKKYETTTNISFDGNIVGKEELTKHLKNLKINATGKINNETNQAMGSIIANYWENQMFKLDYIKDKQSIGVKSDEVVDMYLGIRNNDLDLLAQKFGLSINMKQIKNLNYKDILLDKQTIDLLEQDLKDVLIEQINTDKFTKQNKRKLELGGKGVTVDSYTLVLNDKETYDILSKVLEKILEDEQLLNVVDEKINLLFTDTSQEQKKSKEMIQSYIQNIQTMNFTNEQMIMATIYVLDNKMVKLDISVSKQGKNNQYIIETLEASNTMNFIINHQQNEHVKTKQISLNKSENQVYTMNVKSSEDNQNVIDITIKAKTEGKLESGDVTNAIAVTAKWKENTFEAKIANTIKLLESIEIENLSATNCTFVNDMEKEKIQYLYLAIKERVLELYNEKVQMIRSGQLQEQVRPVNEAVKQHNAQFEMYEGEFDGTIVVELLNKVISSNTSSSGYMIGLKTKLTEEDKTELEGNDVNVEKVQPLADLLESSGIYIINIHYQPVSGAIYKIEIIKKGLEEQSAPQQVVIQSEQ